MNNELGRKITSLTLMTIMLAGGMVIAVPGVVPAAHAANANLFVSAENSQFENYMSGPQVIEVVIIDSDINDTDEAKGEPDVTVNGKILRMVQAVDGNWYGYFADNTQAGIADGTTTVAGQGLDFGSICSNEQATSNIGVTFSDTIRVAYPYGSCSGGSADNNNVVREQKDPSNGLISGDVGQIGITENTWPFVQLYDLNPTGNVVVQYNKGGGAQSTTLTFDTVDHFAALDLDRSDFPRDAQVHVTITDLWLNIDPTDEDSWTFGTNSEYGLSTNYQVFNENGGLAGAGTPGGIIDISGTLSQMMIEDNGILILDVDAQDRGTDVVTIQNNDDSSILCTGTTADTCAVYGIAEGLSSGSRPITITEQLPSSGIFGTYDESDVSNIITTGDAQRRTSATIDYNETPTTILIETYDASIEINPLDDEWNSGEEIPVVLNDVDANKNSHQDEDLDLNEPSVALIPSLRTGNPFTLGFAGTTAAFVDFNGVTDSTLNEPIIVGQTTVEVQAFSDRAIITSGGSSSSGTGSIDGLIIDGLIIDLDATLDDLFNSISDVNHTTTGFKGFNLFNLDVRSFSAGSVDVYLLDSSSPIIDNNVVNANIGATLIADNADPQSLTLFDDAVNDLIFDTSSPWSNKIGLAIATNSGVQDLSSGVAIVADFFSFGFTNDGLLSSERVANQIIRLELEESGDNTGSFTGSLEYVMLNQLNILDSDTYSGLSPIADDPNFIVIEDLTDEDSPRVNYADLAADGTVIPVADQEESPSHSGIVSFDLDSYKIADTVVITLKDLDLNTDSDLIDIYTTVNTVADPLYDIVGDASIDYVFASGEGLGRLLDVTIDDQLWTSANQGCGLTGDTGLAATGFTMVETETASGMFMGSFAIPESWCRANGAVAVSTTGNDLEVNYVDFRDASGEVIEVGDSAGIRANTGSISLDRTVYPVPFGVESDFEEQSVTTPTGRSLFPIHQTGMGGYNDNPRLTDGLDDGEFIGNGDLTIHVRVNDPDFDISPQGEDSIGSNVVSTGLGPVKISVIRGSSVLVLGYAGGSTAQDGTIDTDGDDLANVVQYGPMNEIAPDAGIFEADITLRYTDGPASTQCPSITDAWTALNGASTSSETDRFDIKADSGDYCILQGDILQVEYTDPADASGNINTVTDSATFDLRNGVLQSDKSVYIIGSDMILTLIEPDFDLDNDGAETYDLDLIEWDSDAATVSMGDAGGEGTSFDPEPFNFRETGDSTGIFQIVIEIPEVLDGDRLERGEEIVLEYTDWGPSGSDYVGDEDEDVNITVFTSNFGATVELDQKVYTWTDKVYITIVAPDHNFDSDLVDDIGNTDEDTIKVSTRGYDLSNYKLVETGTDTGIFTGEVILTGFDHDADGDSTSGVQGNDVVSSDPAGSGPTDGRLSADDDDGLTVSFEFSEDETVVGSSLIRWNIGETQWLEASYPASGTGVVRIIDPDMNLNPEAVDNFDVDVWSDSDAGGIDLTVTETNEATGIFEGTVFFTTTDESSGHRLRVAEGDTVTAEYEDNTLPDPYTTADELDITATTLIGTVVPPLERVPATNLRVVDAFGNSLDTVSVDQQVQITADLANGQDREQAFAYLVQIQNDSGVTVSLDWITGSLSANQLLSPASSWMSDSTGAYTATVFVWESVDNPTALSPPVNISIQVSN